jgi:hypothetical protein
MLHSVEDALGAHLDYIKNGCEGHALDYFLGQDPDKVIGDAKFVNAANKVFQMLSGKEIELTTGQINELIDKILLECGSNFKVIRPHGPNGGRGGPGPSGPPRQGGRHVLGSDGPGGGFGGYQREFDWYELLIRSESAGSVFVTCQGGRIIR